MAARKKTPTRRRVVRVELDHVVLEVRDPVASAAFYEGVLGFAPVRLAEYQAGSAPFLSSRVGPGTLLDLFPPRLWRGPAPQNPHHLCVALSAEAFRALERRLSERGIPITRRQDHNFGARGFGRSVYFEDPDGLSIEVRYYP
jgi:catechol 2,3-dioxygenase-like lactoylglutathione lyase family enzyme